VRRVRIRDPAEVLPLGQPAGRREPGQRDSRRGAHGPIQPRRRAAAGSPSRRPSRSCRSGAAS
jgi:hypothetical protein